MDIASLGVRIDTSQAKTAVSELDRLATIGAKAEKALIATTDASNRQAKGMSEGARAAQANSRSIDNYVKSLQAVAATTGTGARETKLYELALRGASRAQLEAASSSIRMIESFQRGQQIGEKIRRGFVAISAAALAAAVSTTYIGKSMINALAEFKDLSETTGASVENISALDQVARSAGGNFETVSSSLLKFNQVLGSLDGKNDASRIIKALNLDAKELKSLDPAEALRRVAVAFSGYADDGNKARAVQELFGKSVKEVGPFLRDLAEQQSLHAKTTAESARQADDFNKQLSSLKSEAETAGRSLVESLLPALNRILQNFNEIRKQGNLGLIVKDAAKDVVGLGKLTGDNGADITTFMQERDRLQKDLDFAARKGLPIRDLQSRLDENQRYLQVVRAKQRTELAGLFGGDYADAVSRKQKPVQSLQVASKAGKADKTGERLTKATLGYDIEDIRNESAALLNTISNESRELEALRSAALMKDEAYFAEKRALVEGTTRVQEAALEAEIDRLKRETLTGVASIENAKKVADAEAKLAVARANGITDLVVLDTQRAKTLTDITIRYAQATAAAKAYVDAISTQNGRELAGMGQGSQQREVDERRTQREDQFLGRRQDLDGQLRSNQITAEQYERYLQIERDAFAQSLSEDEKYFAERRQKESKYFLGAAEALRNHLDESRNVYKLTEQIASKAFQGIEDSLVSFVTTGKADFRSLANSIIADMARIQIKQGITGPLASAASSLFGGFFADGGRPPLNRVSVVGENGPELFIPDSAGTIIPNQGSRNLAAVGAMADPGASGVSVVINQSFTSGGGAESSGQNQASAKAFGNLLEVRIREVISQEQRQGGTLWRARNGY